MSEDWSHTLIDIALIELNDPKEDDADEFMVFAAIQVEVAGMLYTLKSGGQMLKTDCTKLDRALAYGKQLGWIQGLMTAWNMEPNYGEPWYNVNVFRRDYTYCDYCDEPTEQTRKMEGYHGNIEFNDSDQ